MTDDTKNDDNIVDINRWRDFNDAEPQRLDGAWPSYDVESADEIKSRMLVNIRGVLSYLLPGGVFQRGKFFVGDIHGNRGDSLVVEIEGRKAGLWHDFATGEGGDIIGLWAAATGRDIRVDFQTVILDILAWLEGRTRTLQEDRVGKPRRKKPPVDELGPITAKWDYLDDDGRLIAVVYRYDPPGGKQFRPWDVKARKARAPDPRPLYNRPGIKAASEVVLVEGEKAADALIEQGICATTAMNGASAPVAKTDWSPLKGKRVSVWPDKDEPGRQYATAASQAVLEAGAASVAVLTPPADKPDKWDAADAVAERLDVTSFIATAPRQAVRPAEKPLELPDWFATRYAGDAPKQQFLVDGSIPLGVVSVLAAMGDTGKGMITLDPALSVATGKPRAVSVSPEPMAFGGARQCVRHRRRDHRRGRRSRGAPPPRASRSRTAASRTTRTPDRGAAAQRRRADPARHLGPSWPRSDRAVPRSARPARSHRRSQARGVRSAVVLHPCRRQRRSGRQQFRYRAARRPRHRDRRRRHRRSPHAQAPRATGRSSTVEQARDAVRGTSALVDGVRLVYALWPTSEEYQSGVFKALDEKPVRNAVFQGAPWSRPTVSSTAPFAPISGRPPGLLIDITGALG